jgi:folate-binding protein YgfZ
MSDLEHEITTLRSGAGARLRPELFTLRLTGPDRVRYLNGMVSNDVASLAPGQALYAVKANNKGKVEGLLRVRATEGAFLLDVLEVAANAVAGAMVKLLVMDDATLSDATDERQVVEVHGPRAQEILQAAGYPAADLAPLTQVVAGAVTVLRDDAYGLPGFELHVPAGKGEAVLQRLAAAGAVPVGAAALDVLRVEAGVPVDGRELDDDTIPQEARLERALSFTKGCYVGQETIARAHNLGGVKHHLVGFRIDGDTLPPAGAQVEVDAADKAAGTLTSVVRSPTLRSIIALGYLRTAHEREGAPVRITWGEGEGASAVVCRLPFVE